MRHSRAWGVALLAAGALLLLPAVGSAQIATRNFNYYPGYYSYGYFPYNWGYSSPYNTYAYWPYAYGAPGLGYPGAYASYPYANSGYYAAAPAGVSGYYGTTNYYAGSPLTNGYGVGTGAMRDYSYGAMSAPGRNRTVHLNVRLPEENAEVWIQGQRTQQRGTWREFVSPPLTGDRNYVYDIRARWTEDGRDVEQTRTVPVQPSGVATVDFTRPDNHSRVDELNRGSDSTRPRSTLPAGAPGGTQPTPPRSGGTVPPPPAPGGDVKPPSK
jgi:uncharacterized protein (TIGR03000 family)